MLATVFQTFIVGALCVAGISRVSAQEKTMRVAFFFRNRLPSAIDASL